ncbi:glycosyltransferase family 4 protein [Priestia megaterium]|uniref:glycosyltransferase family 4 protein n=1 Tax=Priestia megaterium TaxID=1404 RepID=UPI0011AA5AE6|nr:glycosyltransferase family 1 protein [Priestia megaterium]
MKICINGRFLSQEITGVQRYSMELVKALDALLNKEKNIQVEILCPPNIIHSPELQNIQIRKIGILKGHLWEQLELPLYSRNSLLFNPCGPAPLLKFKQILTIHDAAIYANSQAFTKKFIIWYKIMFFLISKTAKKIITVSEFSKNELINYLKVKNSHIKVMHLGKEHITEIKEDTSIIEKYELDKKPFILAVSSMSPNKNFNGVVKSIEHLDKNNEINIVIAGGVHPKVFGGANNFRSDQVKHVGYITDNELKTLYKNALCFVYPSYYEGFGLPPLEAMSLRCPVIVSDRASLPEVGGANVLYCNPDDPADIAQKISLMIKNSNINQEYKDKGYKRSKDFSWYKCAQGLLETCKEVSKG